MKKLVSLFLALLMLGALPMAALAETWGDADFTLQPPEGAYHLGPELPEDDALWALAGVADPAGELQNYAKAGVLAQFVTQDGTVITVMKKESDINQSVYDLNLLTEEEKQQFMGRLGESEDDLHVDKGWYTVGDRLFYWLRLDLLGDNPMYELAYGTIVNGYAINIDLYSMGEPITPQQEETLLAVVDSLRITRVTEKPAPQPVDVASTVLLLLLLLAAVAVPLIYIPLKGKADKKRKARLAEQLSEYHRTHGADQADGEVLFVNDTDCTKEAIHTFSVYQAYVKNIGEVIFGGVMCLVMVSTAFLIDAAWWMKLVAIAIAAYYAYKVIGMAATVEKIQRKVHGRGQSQTAHYTFYPAVFRVSGIQSASVIPYFQLTDLRRKGQYLYLYYGPDNAYMVDQYGFTQGEFEEFVDFIQKSVQKQP